MSSPFGNHNADNSPKSWVNVFELLQAEYEAHDILDFIARVCMDNQYASQKARARWLASVTGACQSTAENWLSQDSNTKPSFTYSMKIMAKYLDHIGLKPCEFAGLL